MENKTIVILGNTRFDSDIQATSLFIARGLAKNNKVFFVDYPFTLKDYYAKDNAETLELRENKFSYFSDGLMDTDLPNLKVIITPPVVPVNFLPEGIIYRTALKLNEDIIAARIKKVLKKQKITSFIYINAFNFHYPNLAKQIKPALTVYHCVDPIIVPYDVKHGRLSEQQLVKESDVVICTSKALYNEKLPLNKNTYFVPNASDVDHFNAALDTALPVHEKLKDIPKPVIGYLGTIERRIDYELLMDAAKANTARSFVLAGPVWGDHIPASMAAIPNIYTIGPIPYNEIPQLVKGFDVAIIPFKKDAVSNTIFPLKLFEYLAAGKPVVVTDFNDDLKEYTGDAVNYADSAVTFIKMLDSVLSTDSADKIAARLAIARLNTWEQRTTDIANIIDSHL